MVSCYERFTFAAMRSYSAFSVSARHQFFHDLFAGLFEHGIDLFEAVVIPVGIGYGSVFSRIAKVEDESDFCPIFFCLGHVDQIVVIRLIHSENEVVMFEVFGFDLHGSLPADVQAMPGGYGLGSGVRRFSYMPVARSCGSYFPGESSFGDFLFQDAFCQGRSANVT